MTDPKPSDISTASWRLRTYPIVVLAALVGALLLATSVYDRDDPTSRLGGDYPSFYGAGSIVRDGDWDQLYSGERQQLEQAGLIDDVGGYLYFSYPPFVAAVYGQFVGFGYQWSFLLHTLLLGLALAGAVRLLWPWLQHMGLPPVAVTVIALGFYPVLRAIPGGQNTTFSLLLVAAALRLDHEDQSVAAGFVAAMLLYKPQFGVVLVALLLVARRWRMLAGWLAGAASLYAISAMLMGGEWVRDWWAQAGAFRDLNLDANGANFVSFPGFLENVLGLGSGLAWAVGYGLAALVGGLVAFYWWKNPNDLALQRWTLAAAAVVVAAPQTLYYDTGLLLLGLVPFSLAGSRRLLLVVGSLLTLSWTQLGAGSLAWSPLGPIAWVGVALLLYSAFQSRSPPQAA